MFTNPILRGDDRIAFRDPTAIWRDGVWHLIYTLVENPPDGPFFSLGESTSTNLVHWTPPRRFTPHDRALNYSSPGNVVELPDGTFVLCFQTYCRENGEKYGNARSRLYTMRSRDLVSWSEPRLLRVKGDDVPESDMGRMIDPYLLRGPDGLWWCIYKQNGASFSSSPDLETWTYRGRIDAGENCCCIPAADGDGYLLFHSPHNGIGVKRSRDLVHWEDALPEPLVLRQSEWPWAQGRITAGFVYDARNLPGVGRFVMFFHGSGPLDEETYFDTYASLGIAFSDDLLHWDA